MVGCRTGLAEARWCATLATCGLLKVPQVLPGYDLGLPQFGALELALRPPPADDSLQALTRSLANRVDGHAQRPCRWGHHWPILVPAPRPPGHRPSSAPSWPCDKSFGPASAGSSAVARRQDRRGQRFKSSQSRPAHSLEARPRAFSHECSQGIRQGRTTEHCHRPSGQAGARVTRASRELVNDWSGASPAPSGGLQFGLQFTAVRHRPRQTDQWRWSRLNRSGRPRPELLMRFGFAPIRGSNPRASARDQGPRTEVRGPCAVSRPVPFMRRGG